MLKKICRGLFILLILFLLPLSVFAESIEEIKQIIINQAIELGVEPVIVLSIAKVESGFNQSLKSAGGHIGIFQLSPATADNMRLDPYDLNDNIKCGILYYKTMYEKFDSMELAIAAYNSGYYAVKRNNNSVPDNSKKFVERVIYYYNIYKKQGY